MIGDSSLSILNNEVSSLLCGGVGWGREVLIFRPAKNDRRCERYPYMTTEERRKRDGRECSRVVNAYHEVQQR